MRVLNVRSTAIAAALLIASTAASALTIATNALVADSTQKFSQEAMDGFELTGVTITPLGNAKASPAPPTPSFPDHLHHGGFEAGHRWRRSLRLGSGNRPHRPPVRPLLVRRSASSWPTSPSTTTPRRCSLTSPPSVA